MLQPQDIGLLNYLLWQGILKPTNKYDRNDIMSQCCMGEQHIQESLERLFAGHLVSRVTGHVHVASAKDVFLAIPSIYPGQVTQETTSGLATAGDAPKIKNELRLIDGTPLVWQYNLLPEAPQRVVGIAVEPLFQQAPTTARRNEHLYFMLAVIDCLRYGKAREKEYGVGAINRVLEQYTRITSQTDLETDLLCGLCV